MSGLGNQYQFKCISISHIQIRYKIYVDLCNKKRPFKTNQVKTRGPVWGGNASVPSL